MMHFDTDYMEGSHPDVMRRLLETNLEQTVGYGSDPYTQRAKDLIRKACGVPEAGVHFLVGGTQTNSTVIDGLLRQHEGVIAAETAHINVHESGAIEATGHKVLTLPQHNGKLEAEEVEKYITDFYRDETYEHMVAPGMVYISHPTELGTLYSLDELEKLSAVCRRANIPLYMDGARLGYGLAAENTEVTLTDIARLCDVFYIGGTKVGALFGEAVVAPDPKRLPHFFPLIKQHGALLAKGRLLGIQFETLFTDHLYERMGKHAVRLALKLKEAFKSKGYKLQLDSPTNQQFVCLPNETIDRLLQHATFELWGPRGEKETVVRFVTSWATREEDVDAFIRLL
ncbi:MAG: low specificity L-threonine aldolase [Bacteroides sp.]|nr:low specificity L-threonine aldolase [Bacteroides sp.]